MGNAIGTVTPCRATAAQLVEDLGSMLDAVRGIASRLEFIGGGLATDDPNPLGATLALRDTEMVVLDLVKRVERMTQCARELAGVPTETAGGELNHE